MEVSLRAGVGVCQWHLARQMPGDGPVVLSYGDSGCHWLPPVPRLGCAEGGGGGRWWVNRGWLGSLCSRCLQHHGEGALPGLGWLLESVGLSSCLLGASWPGECDACLSAPHSLHACLWCNEGFVTFLRRMARAFFLWQRLSWWCLDLFWQNGLGLFQGLPFRGGGSLSCRRRRGMGVP